MMKNQNQNVSRKPKLACPTKVFEQYDKAFQNVSAYVVMKDGSVAATVTFKSPKDGAGRLWAYVHFIGLSMVRGFANGYGYDKRSAAIENAIRAYGQHNTPSLNGFDPFLKALARTDGTQWANSLRSAGFAVFQVI